jgi:diphthine-ammonia ligase
MQVFVSWSGGKDCSYARYLAEKSGLEVKYLLNMVSADGLLSWSHNVPTEILETQSRAMGVPLIQHRTTQAEYETEYKRAIAELKRQGVTGGVFGDIDFEPHREWVTRVCNEAGIEPILPLWGLAQDKIIEDFVTSGHKAKVVVTKAELMGEEWLGRTVNRSFIRDLNELSQTKNITLCGEAGEYHTLVIDGPQFKKKLVIQETSKNLREGYWFLDIKKYELKEK